MISRYWLGTPGRWRGPLPPTPTQPGGPPTQPRAPSGFGSYQSGEEGDSQVPEVVVQQAAVHHVPEDGDAS